MTIQEKDIMNSGANSIVYKESINKEDCIVKVCKNPNKFDEWLFCARKENKMLSMLQQRRKQLSADIPLMRIDNDYGKVRIVQSVVNGEFLSKNMYNSLSHEERQKIAKDLAEVMYAIHNLDINELATVTNNGYIPKERPDKDNIDMYFHGKYEDCIDALGKMVTPETKGIIDTFLRKNFNQLDRVNTHVVPIHNDIRYSNIFYDTGTKKLGVIDFGGCEVNDIYHDFASIGLPNSLGFECQKDVIDHYNVILAKDNKGYQISYDTAKAYSIAKMTWFAKMMYSSEKVQKTLFPESAGHKIVGMEDYLKSAGIICNDKQEVQDIFTPKTEDQGKKEISSKLQYLREQLLCSSPMGKIKTIGELRGTDTKESPKPVNQTTLDIVPAKQKTY